MVTTTPSVSLLHKTKQRWKLVAVFVLFVIPGLILALLLFVPWNVFEKKRIAIQLLLTGTGVVGLTVFLATLRCPRCRRSLGRWALTNSSGVFRLLALQRCPYCGFEEAGNK
jgi:hypothetical protein